MQRCGHCGEGQSGWRWAVHAGSGQQVCAACARHADSHGGELPSPDTLQERRRQEAQRKRQRQAVQEQEEVDGERRCSHCGTNHSKPWRLDLLTGERLCNNCRGWQEKHGGELPPPAHLQKRQRLQRQRQLEKDAGDGRICGRCSSYYQQYRRLPDEDVLARRRQRDAERQQGQRCSHCGSAETSRQWDRHPDTGALLCHYCNAHRQRKQGRLPSPERLRLREVERERRQQEAAEGGEPRCSHCGAVGQREWRRHSRTRERLCIPCANFDRKHGGELPPVDELEVRQQRRTEREEGLPQRQQRQQPERQEQQQGPEGEQQPHRRRRKRQLESSEDEGEHQERQHPDALDGGQEQPPRRRRRRPADEQQQQLRCSHCSSDEAGNNWRRHPATRQRLCSWCFTHQQKQGGELPPADLVERQQREREQRRREAAADEKRCTHCGSADGGLWRRERTTRALLCNRCGTWADSHAGILPPAEVIMQRQQRQAVRQAEAEQGVKRCTHCHSQSSGGLWRRHPETGERLCLPCADAFLRISHLPDDATLQQRMRQRQRRQQARAAASQEPDAPGGQEQRQQQRQQEQGQEEQAHQPSEQEEQQREGEERPPQQQPQQQRWEPCSHCGDDASQHTRRHPVTSERLCSSCRGYLDKHMQLPPAGVLQRWQRLRQQRQREQGAERCCSHCGISGAGVAWRRHPVSLMRVCEPCHYWQATHDGELPPASIVEQRRRRQQGRNGQAEQRQLVAPERQRQQQEEEQQQGAQQRQVGANEQQQQRQQLEVPDRTAHAGLRRLPSAPQQDGEHLKREPPAQPKAEGDQLPAGRQGSSQPQPREPQQQQQTQREPPAQLLAEGDQLPPRQQRGGQPPAPQRQQPQQEPPVQRQRPQREQPARLAADGGVPPPRQHGGGQPPKPPARGARPVRPPVQRQCLECGSHSKGAGRCSTWRRHPVTRAEWLCQACYCKASLRARLEQLRRQELGEEEEGEEEGAEEAEEEPQAGTAVVQQGTRQERQRPGRGEEEPLPGQGSEEGKAPEPAAAAAGKRAKRQHPAGDPAAAPAKRRRQQAQQEAGDQALDAAGTVPRERKAKEVGSGKGKRPQEGSTPSLASLLEAATGQAAAAAWGLTPEVAAACTAHLAEQAAEERGALEGRLCSLLGQQRYGAVVELMQATLRQAGSGTDGQAGGDVPAAGAAAAGTARRRAARQRQVEQQGTKEAGQQGQCAADKQAQQRAQKPKPDPNAEPALSRMLRAAAHDEAAAAEGLTPELVAAFLGVLPQLQRREQADKEGALTHMVQRQRFAAAAAVMRAAVERAGAA